MAQTPLRFVGVSAARAFFFTSRTLVHLLAHQARKQAVSPFGHSHEKQHGEFTKRNIDISIVATCARDVWQGDNRVLTESLCWQGVYMKSPRPPQGTLPAPPFSIFLAIFRRTEAPVEKNVADTLQSTGSPHFRRKRTAQHCGSHTRSASCTLLENGPSQGLRKVSAGSNFWQGVYRGSKVAGGVGTAEHLSRQV